MVEVYPEGPVHEYVYVLEPVTVKLIAPLLPPAHVTFVTTLDKVGGVQRLQLGTAESEL